MSAAVYGRGPAGVNERSLREEHREEPGERGAPWEPRERHRACSGARLARGPLRPGGPRCLCDGAWTRRGRGCEAGTGAGWRPAPVGHEAVLGEVGVGWTAESRRGIPVRGAREPHHKSRSRPASPASRGGERRSPAPARAGGVNVVDTPTAPSSVVTGRRSETLAAGHESGCGFLTPPEPIPILPRSSPRAFLTVFPRGRGVSLA